MNIYIAIAALSISIISFVLTIWFNHRQLGVQSLTSLSHMINLERSISNIPSAFRFHGITELQIIDADITPEELAYLVSSITAGGIYHRTHSPNCSKPFPADSYRYNMCKTEEFRKAWPLVKKMMNGSNYIQKIDKTIKLIENA